MSGVTIKIVHTAAPTISSFYLVKEQVVLQYDGYNCR